MKHTYLYTTILCSLLFVSCNNEIVETHNGEIGNAKEVIGTIEPIKHVDFEELATRTTLSYTNTGMKFAWENEDPITVFAEKSDQTKQEYTVFAGGGSQLAKFDGGGFDLTPGERYFAITTTEGTAPIPTVSRIPDKRNITLTYAGQRQTGNESTTHLGAYDYMAATDVANELRSAKFHFYHLGATIRIYVTMPDAAKDIAFKQIEMFDSENSFHQPVRTLNLTKGVTDEGYTPAWDELDTKSSDYMNSPRFTLDLGPEENPGIKPREIDRRLIAYMEVPPFDFTNKDVIFKFIPVDPSKNTYYVVWSKHYNIVAGGAYQVNGTAATANDYKLSIKINRLWQHGNTTDNSAKTRATGDPGLDKEYDLPKYVYYVFFAGENIQQVSDKYINKIVVGENGWKASSDETIFTLWDTTTDKSKQINLSTNASGEKNVYIIASTIDLSESLSVTPSTTKTDIEALKYSIQEKIENEQVVISKQEFLRDLYSTPLPTSSSEVFVGKLTEPYQDITLYHTAAKVDLKWNNETSTALSGNVSVNSVKDTGLYLFKPTENTYDSGSYTVSAPITTGTMWNGRQVFYLPQFTSSCQYKVTIGDKTQDVTFSPSTANGFTSWLRWLKTYPATVTP